VFLELVEERHTLLAGLIVRDRQQLFCSSDDKLIVGEQEVSLATQKVSCEILELVGVDVLVNSCYDSCKEHVEVLC